MPNQASLSENGINLEGNTILGFLADQEVKFDLCFDYHKQHINYLEQTEFAKKIIKGQLLEDDLGIVLAITTANRYLDHTKICEILGRDLVSIDVEKTEWQQYYDKLLGAYIPLASCFGAYSIIDQDLRITSEEQIYVPIGIDSIFLSLKFSEFYNLNPTMVFKDISTNIIEKEIKKPICETTIKQINNTLVPSRIKTRVAEIHQLPAMPGMANELLKLRVDDNADALSLAKLVKQDPLLSAQLISWACSPYYGYSGKITSVEDAIVKVLGYDLVMNISIGIALSKSISISDSGPLGITRYWQHSIYSAVLSESLLRLIPHKQRPNRGLVYLGALLQNFGHLLLGYMFPPQFELLNQSISLNSHLPVITIEHHLFTVDHQQIGEWLLREWGMPEEIVAVIYNHHDYSYAGDYSNYVWVVQVANQLLTSKGIGDERDLGTINSIVNKLQTNIHEVNNKFITFWEERSALNKLISDIKV